MANKQAIALIIDVGAAMVAHRPWIDAVIQAATTVVQQKLLFAPRDEVSVVLYGTKGSGNALHDQGMGYAHVTVSRTLQPADHALRRQLEALTVDSGPADFVDALVVGIHMLCEHCGKRKVTKRIFHFVHSGTPVKWDAPTYKNICSQINAQDIRLNIIGIDFSPEGQPPKPTQAVLEAFVADLDMASSVSIGEALDQMSFFRTKTVLQRPALRTEFELAPDFKIPVQSFVKVKAQSAPRMDLSSRLMGGSAAPADQGRTYSVVRDTSYASVDDPNKLVPEDHRTKAYRYGKTLVPFNKVDVDQLKYGCPKVFRLIGTVKRDRIPRHHFMSDDQVVVAPPGDQRAIVGLSAFVHALDNANLCAVARLVRMDNKTPVLVGLSPCIKTGFDGLYMHTLPLSEDLREFEFPSFARRGLKPTPAQLDAAGALIDKLSLVTEANGVRSELYKPKDTFNPVIQHVYDCMAIRARDPSVAIPAAGPAIRRFVARDPALFDAAASEIAAFREQLPLTLKVAAAQKNSVREYWGKAAGKADHVDPDAAGRIKVERLVGDGLIDIPAVLSKDIRTIKRVDPVGDFREMISRRDVDLVDDAIAQMSAIILSLVRDSFKTQFYNKAIACIAALRLGCVQELEAERYNSFLRDISTEFQGAKKDDFWQLLAGRPELTLIDADEGEGMTTVTKEDAARFFQKRKQPEAPKVLIKRDSVGGDDMGGLLDMLA